MLTGGCASCQFVIGRVRYRQSAVFDFLAHVQQGLQHPNFYLQVLSLRGLLDVCLLSAASGVPQPT